MKKLTLILATLFSSATLMAKDYVLTDFGVKNDSTKLQTEAIQKVIDRAEADGGGRIVVPAGTFLSGALFFKPGTTLHLEKGACIKGSDVISNFPLIPSRMEGRSIYYYAALINAYQVDGFSITGTGTVNGNGLRYWKQFWNLRKERRKEGRSCTNLEVHRPRLVFLWGCDNLRLDGPTFCNSPFWTIHLYECNNIEIANCNITAPREPVRAPSSDAIDLDVCSDVHIHDCYLNCDDDGVCLKGGKGVLAGQLPENGMVKNVLVERCVFGSNLHGALTLGSECIHASNIVLKDCQVATGSALLRLKMRPDTYQIYENISVKNVTGYCGSVIDMKPWTQFFDLEGRDVKPFGQVRNILIENVDVECQSLGIISGNPLDTVENVKLKDVTVKASRPGFECIYPEVKLENVTMNGDIVVNPADGK